MQTPLTFFFAFVAVLVLIGAVAWLVRRFAGNRIGANGSRGRMPRLAVIDAAAVDGRRRLVLVRRDNVEHLLMIGGPTDVVVELNIVRGAPARDQISPRPNIGAEVPSRTGPLPDSANWSDDGVRPDRFDAPEPIAPEPPPVRPSRPLFADEMRRTVPPMERRDPLAAISPNPVTRPEPRPDLRAEPSSRPISRNEPQLPRPALRPSDPTAKAPPMQAPEIPPVALSPVAASPATPPSPVASPPSPSPSSAASTADQNLAEMAQRLEAALRRPGAQSPAEPRVGAPPVASATPPVRPVPRPAGDATVNVPARNENSAAPPVTPPSPKGEFENLEDEMASLLGRPKSPS